MCLRVDAEATPNDDRLQVVSDRRRPAEHQLGLQRIHPELRCSDGIDVDPPGAEPQRSAPAEQRGADHAAATTDDEARCRTCPCACRAAEAETVDRVRRPSIRKPAPGGLWIPIASTTTGAGSVDPRCRMQARLVANERNRSRRDDTRHTADPGARVGIETARHVDRDDPSLGRLIHSAAARGSRRRAAARGQCRTSRR